MRVMFFVAIVSLCAIVLGAEPEAEPAPDPAELDTFIAQLDEWESDPRSLEARLEEETDAEKAARLTFEGLVGNGGNLGRWWGDAMTEIPTDSDGRLLLTDRHVDALIRGFESEALPEAVRAILLDSLYWVALSDEQRDRVCIGIAVTLRDDPSYRLTVKCLSMLEWIAIISQDDRADLPAELPWVLYTAALDPEAAFPAALSEAQEIDDRPDLLTRRDDLKAMLFKRALLLVQDPYHIIEIARATEANSPGVYGVAMLEEVSQPSRPQRTRSRFIRDLGNDVGLIDPIEYLRLASEQFRAVRESRPEVPARQYAAYLVRAFRHFPQHLDELRDVLRTLSAGKPDRDEALRYLEDELTKRSSTR